MDGARLKRAYYGQHSPPPPPFSPPTRKRDYRSGMRTTPQAPPPPSPPYAFTPVLPLDVADAPPRPHILWISSGGHRTSALGCYGNDFAHSPNLDRLARGGVRFTQAHTASPVCSPSRTSVVTGVHVPVHGVYEGMGIVPHRNGVTPLFDVLNAGGYYTAMIGKTHFYPDPVVDYLEKHTGNDDMRAPGTPASEYLETYLVNRTLEFIDNVTALDAAGRWFAHLSMVSPHSPHVVPDGPWNDAYRLETLPPLDYERGDIATLPTQTRTLLGLLGREASDPPEFPGGVANMTHIDLDPLIGRLPYYRASEGGRGLGP